MKPQNSSNCSSESSDDEKAFQGEGYRLVDLQKLSAPLSDAHVCKKGEKTVEKTWSWF